MVAQVFKLCKRRLSPATIYTLLLRRYKNRDKDKPWVFWQRYWSRKESKFVEGPFQDRKKIMGTLCRKVGVRYFRFHPLRHFGASSWNGPMCP